MGEPSYLKPKHQQHHIPVLLTEAVAGLCVKPGGRYLDATVGGAGHAGAILEASTPDGRLLGFDRDPQAAARARAHLVTFGARAQVVHSSYINLAEVAKEKAMLPLDGVLFDLGFSSWQVDDPERGFSFRLDGPLDMRFDPLSNEPSAADLINSLAEPELAALLRHYGEEPHARRIAEAIAAARPIYTTQKLAQVIADELRAGQKRRRLHPATRTFQALRIAVNAELKSVEIALPQALDVLGPGGRLAVITFHSLEDRIVKHFFKRRARGCICPPEIPICVCDHKPELRIITRKPLKPSEEEVAGNPRSRSAKLRVAEKL